ncbi:hypothetical protein F5877DRAFT_85393 [Lentinula edodes]|nr:hypothetical protein F5877DRAFT_85393 [Lentinula edodes]
MTSPLVGLEAFTGNQTLVSTPRNNSTLGQDVGITDWARTGSSLFGGGHNNFNNNFLSMNNKLIGAVPGLLSVAPGRVPVEPEACLESDYPEIEFWHKVTWKSTRRKQSQESYIGNEEDEEEDDKQGKMRGNSRASKGINVSMRWVEEKNGEIIDGYRATYIRGFAFGLLFELLKQGKLPLKWSMASNDVKIWFYTEMARQIPELRYCADHWKTQEIATTIYPGWISRHGGGSVKIMYTV